MLSHYQLESLLPFTLDCRTSTMRMSAGYERRAVSVSLPIHHLAVSKITMKIDCRELHCLFRKNEDSRDPAKFHQSKAMVLLLIEEHVGGSLPVVVRHRESASHGCFIERQSQLCAQRHQRGYMSGIRNG